MVPEKLFNVEMLVLIRDYAIQRTQIDAFSVDYLRQEFRRIDL